MYGKRHAPVELSVQLTWSYALERCQGRTCGKRRKQHHFSQIMSINCLRTIVQNAIVMEGDLPITTACNAKPAYAATGAIEA
jgi:hypothetical protein